MAFTQKFQSDNASVRYKTGEDEMPTDINYQCWWCDACGIVNYPRKYDGVMGPKLVCRRRSCEKNRVSHNGGWCGWEGELPRRGSTRKVAGEQGSRAK